MSVSGRTCKECRAYVFGYHQCPAAPALFFTTWHPPLGTGAQLAHLATTATGRELDAIAEWFGLHRTQQWALNSWGDERYRVEPYDVLRARVQEYAAEHHGY